MTTYIIQYKDTANGQWKNYTDDENFNVEFVTKGGASTVAKDLAASGQGFPPQKSYWQLLDSHGNTHQISLVMIWSSINGPQKPS